MNEENSSHYQVNLEETNELIKNQNNFEIFSYIFPNNRNDVNFMPCYIINEKLFCHHILTKQTA